MPCGAHKLATVASDFTEEYIPVRQGCRVLSGFVGVTMPLRFERRLTEVHARIDELEKSPAAAYGLVVLTEAAEELRELKAEAEYLAALAA